MHFFSSLRLRRKLSSKHCTFSAIASSKLQVSANTDLISKTQQSRHYLPPEIVDLILKFIPSLQDLKSFIRASPLLYRCYVARRRWVLTEVLTRELSPQLLLLLVACVKAQNIAGSQASDSAFKEFVDKYSLNDNQFSEHIQAELVMEIDQVIRLHDIVSSCVIDFASYCFQCYPTSLHTRDSTQQLSPTERCRLFRSFYRYELFARLFSDYSYLAQVYDLASVNNYRLGCFDEIRTFFSYLSPWEAEEIRCVYEYLVYKYDTVISEIGQQNMAFNKGRSLVRLRSNNMKSFPFDPSKHLHFHRR